MHPILRLLTFGVLLQLPLPLCQAFALRHNAKRKTSKTSSSSSTRSSRSGSSSRSSSAGGIFFFYYKPTQEREHDRLLSIIPTLGRFGIYQEIDLENREEA